MENPTNSIVDELGLGECLVTTLMSDDPKPGSNKACRKPIQ